ncbi:hypothetical protein MU516_13025 [Paracoccus sp. YLB-12]|uniref:Phage gp6-like head-tail connector protein n=1 Tax=Paracoccus maritimus TaxID=2933292 RepID=A0ABT2KBA4_9RHOB|nr:hypothetical protein [Paracoccus sp. YLB-12]MCT4333787.1 hypothetical protein [Paracoccus sp. YLB-12]
MTHTRTPISTAAAWHLSDVKERGRIDGDDEDAGIAMMADTAAAEIERHCELALLAQTITVTVDEWCNRIPLPVGPFWAAGASEHPVEVEAVAEDGSTSNVTGFYVLPGRYPILKLTETVAAHGLRITYPAGYGEEVGSIPADLQLAISDHAARLYDMRGADDAPQGLSIAAARIAARHRRVAI